MQAYDATLFEPPAPVAYVSLQDPRTGAAVSNVPLLIDTGAVVLGSQLGGELWSPRRIRIDRLG